MNTAAKIVRLAELVRMCGSAIKTLTESSSPARANRGETLAHELSRIADSIERMKPSMLDEDIKPS